jgi:phosphoserine phosphatase
MKTLYLVRHGETAWNAEQRMQGWRDSALTERGVRHARSHAALLEREAVQALVVSPLGRARETAAIINARLGLPTRIDARLKERSYGDWEGLTLDEIERRWPDEWADRRRDPFHFRPPGGESLADLIARIAAAIDEVSGHDAERVAIVSHGMTGRALLAHVLELAPAVANTARQPNDVVYRIAFDGGRACAHYRDGDGPFEGLFSR